MARSEVTIDLAALRHNVGVLLAALGGAELWAVVKADAYGHGALECGETALEAGATALCVATVPEALALRPSLPDTRIVVMGPAVNRHDVAASRSAGLELVVGPRDPRGRQGAREARHGDGPLGRVGARFPCRPRSWG